MADRARPARVIVDLGAIAHNVEILSALVAPAQLWAVVKADGYGHGAVPVAVAALDAGATGLCVALVDEGETLRAAGVDAPILVLADPPTDAVARAVASDLRLTVSRLETADTLARAGGGRVHIKVDTGMHRIGVPPAELAEFVAELRRRGRGVEIEGVWSHLAVADDPADSFTGAQLEAFDRAVAGIDAPLTHLANSAGAITTAGARRSLVRCGIAVYGLAPSPALAGRCAALDLRPALRLVASVSAVRRIAAGDAVSYGRCLVVSRPTTIATVPLGYADGVPRRWFEVGGEALVGGRRRPIAGTVTMDQLMLDCGDDPVAVGDEVVMIGRQGGDAITVGEWAERLGTITYEVTCGLSSRVPRWYER